MNTNYLNPFDIFRNSTADNSVKPFEIFNSLLNKLKGEKIHLKKNAYTLGLDLGTTNSTLTKIDRSSKTGLTPKLSGISIDQETPRGRHEGLLIPSIVAIDQNTLIVGEGAKKIRDDQDTYRLSPEKNIFFNTKNEIGTKKDYHRAPKGFRSPHEIAGKIINFLIKAAEFKSGSKPVKTVITVPASFQSAQRADTFKAAELAGLQVDEIEFLDEPVAAFLDFLFTYANQGENLVHLDSTPKNILVFDFGGGTCDVAVFKVYLDKESDICISPISISRYHRLGGGDIDTAIVHEVILPQFCRENKLQLSDIEYEDKKRVLEPAFLNLAEELKIDLCNKINKTKNPSSNFNDLSVSIEKNLKVTLWNEKFELSNTKLTKKDFDKILKPFLDQEFLYAKQTEYRTECSIFSPLKDCLERGKLRAANIDYVLLAGGSSLIPKVKKSVKKYFTSAKVLVYPNAESTQVTVSRGAAWYSLALATTGKRLINPVSSAGISIVTEQGPVEIIPRGVKLPYPGTNAPGVFKELTIPKENLLDNLKVTVEIVSSEDESVIYKEIWDINEGIVNEGDPIQLKYNFSENQILSLELMVDDGVTREPFQAQIENPLCHVVNSNKKFQEIQELESSLKNDENSLEEKQDQMTELAELYYDVNHNEKSIAVFKKVLNSKSQPDFSILNRLADIYGDMNNHEQEVKMYERAAHAGNRSSTPFFNMALSYKQRGDLDKALENVNKALERGYSPAYLTLKGNILGKLNQEEEARGIYQEAMNAYGPVENQASWELYWYKNCARCLNDKQAIAEAVKANEALKDSSNTDDSNTKTKETSVYPRHQI